MKKLIKRINQLEDRVEELESRIQSNVRGSKMNAIADWILKEVKKAGKKGIHANKLFVKGRSLGYTTQMIQRSKREFLSDKIAFYRDGQQFVWVHDDERSED